MNGANNKEVDLLLRSLASAHRNSALHSGLTQEKQTPSDHLDADELNSYAEGVVPPPARVRYTEHLADCALCRGIVVGLTQATGTTSRHEVAQQLSESGFWHKLAAVFSPSVLRYAVPALVLTGVIGIGLFALKQERKASLVADNQREIVQPQRKDSASALTPSSEPSPTIQSEADRSTTAQHQINVQDKKLQGGKAPLDSATTLSKAAPVKELKGAEEAEAGAGAGSVVDLRPGYAAQPKAAEPPPPLEGEKSADLAMNRSAKREDQDRSRDAFKNQSDNIHGPNRAANNAPTSTTSQRVMGGLTSERGPSAMNKNSRNEVETRTVLGKRFTRAGAVWVDTDYESQATIKVSRGSEQFRALVADEPGIRTIAERLDGAIIVVWKNRVYRIQ